MRYSWQMAVAVSILCGRLLGDEPRNRYEVVTPRHDEINAVGINGRGDIIGFEWVENKNTPGVVEELPFFARGAEVTRLPLLKTYTATFPSAVSDDGTVVGRSSKPAPRGVAVPLRNQAFVWSASKGISGLGTLEEDLASFATDISADGRRISGFSVGINRVHACVWDRDGEGWKSAVLPFVSNLGWKVVAMSDDGKYLSAVDGEKPVLWSEQPNGRWSQEFIGIPGSMVPRGVNNSGLVVGVRFTPDALTHAVVWSRDAGMRLLKIPQGYERSEALALNNRGVVVGMIDGPRGSKTGPRAFVSEAGKLRILDEGGPAFTSAQAINDRGQVTGVFEKEETEEKTPDSEQIKKQEKK